MKRTVLAAALVLVLICSAALSERIFYAEQNGVRVFEENGLLGLTDADGNTLLPAQFERILPFSGDYAVVRQKPGRMGLICRDGRIVIPCEYQKIDLWEKQDKALAHTEDHSFQQLIDLTDGTVLLENTSSEGKIRVNGDRIFRNTWHEDDSSGESIYSCHTDVFDLRMELLLSTDQLITDRLGGYYLVSADEMPQSQGYTIEYDPQQIIDGEGNVVIDRILYYRWMRDDGLHYTRLLPNPLRVAYDMLRSIAEAPVLAAREHLKENRQAFQAVRSALCPLEASGILREDGTRFEVPGSDISEQDEAGLYRLNLAGLWGYVDSRGAWVIPPQFKEAYAFVDGSAIVSPDGKTWMLIDVNGKRSSDLVWESRLYGFRSSKLRDVFGKSTILPVPTSEGICLFNRRGERICREIFAQLAMSGYPAVEVPELSLYDRHTIALRDAQGRVCLVDDTGRIKLRIPADSFYADYGMNLMEIKQDGLTGLIRPGEDGGFEWVLEPVFRLWFLGHILVTENTLYVDDTENGYQVFNRNGELLFPPFDRD